MKETWPLLTYLLMILLLSSCTLMNDKNESTKEDMRLEANIDTTDEVVETGLTGAIYYIQRPPNGDQKIMRTITPAGSTDVIYTAPELSQLHEFDVSLNGDLLVFALSPPLSDTNALFDRTTLSTLDLADANSKPATILGGESSNEFYNMPILSPDGRYLFYSRLGPDRLGLTGTDTFYGIERYDRQTGQTLPIVPNSIWPQVSPDGRKILFIVLDLATQQRGLGIANSNGAEAELLIDIGRYFDIDSPIFSPDGQSIYLSIVETQPTNSLIERLFGVKVASAHTEHNIPSTWWQLKLNDEGQEPIPLNSDETIINNGRFHPSLNYLAFSTATSIQLLDLETSSEAPEAPEKGALGNKTSLPSEELISGTDFGMLDWVGQDSR